MTNVVRYAGKNSNRLHSPNLWRHIDFEAIKRGTIDGVYFFDDFLSGGGALSSNHIRWFGGTGSGPVYYDFFGTTGVTLAPVTNSADGETIGELVATVDADDEEAYLSIDATYGSPLGKISDTAGENKKVLFETRVKFEDVASGSAAFGKAVGLGQTGMAATGTFGADAATMGTLEFVGFRAFAADGDGMDATHFDAAEVVVEEAADDSNLVITADTYAKFGLYFDGTKTWWYVNGVRIEASGILPGATNFPDGELLVPVWALRDHGVASAKKMTIDWWAFAAMEVSG